MPRVRIRLRPATIFLLLGIFTLKMDENRHSHLTSGFVRGYERSLPFQSHRQALAPSAPGQPRLPSHLQPVNCIKVPKWTGSAPPIPPPSFLPPQISVANFGETSSATSTLAGPDVWAPLDPSTPNTSKSKVFQLSSPSTPFTVPPSPVFSSWGDMPTPMQPTPQQLQNRKWTEAYHAGRNESFSLSPAPVHLRPAAAAPLQRRAKPCYDKVVKPQLCDYFLKTGICRKGKECDFLHVIVLPDDKPLPSRICTFFQQSSCKKANMCDYAHVIHESKKQELEQRLVHHEEIRSATRLCSYHWNGHCKKASACSFVHATPRDRVPVSARRCQFFTAQARCKKGNRCMFAHVVDADASSMPSDLRSLKQSATGLSSACAPGRPQPLATVTNAPMKQ